MQAILRSPRRRSVLGAATAALIAANTQAAAAGAPDDPLKALWQKHREVLGLYQEACRQAGLAYDRAEKSYPPRPPITYWRNHHTGEVSPMTRDDIYRIGEGVFGQPSRRDRMLAALDGWTSACDAVEARFGVPELETEIAALAGQLDAVAAEIIRTRPAGLSGVLVKVKLLAHLADYSAELIHEADPEERLVMTLVEDLELLV